MIISFVLDNNSYLFQTDNIESIHPMMSKNYKPMTTSIVRFNDGRSILVPTKATNFLLLKLHEFTNEPTLWDKFKSNIVTIFKVMKLKLSHA